MKRCIRCGANLNDNDYACSYCGQPQQTMPNGYSNINRPYNMPYNNPNNSNNKKGIIIAIICSVLIIILLVVVLLLLNNKSENNEENGENFYNTNTIIDNSTYTYGNDIYQMTYDRSWSEQYLRVGNESVKSLVYKDNKLGLYPIGESNLDETASVSFSTEAGKKQLYDDFYEYWSESDGDIQSGSNGFTKIGDDLYYAYVNYGNSKTDILGQSFIIVSEINNIVLTFQSQCSSNYSQYGDIAANIVKSIKIKQMYKYVGTDEMGYVRVPIDWVQFKDVDGNSAFQYSDAKGEYVLSMQTYPTSEVDAYTYIDAVYAKLKNEMGFENISTASAKVNGYKAYQISVNYSDGQKYLAVWTFEDGKGTTHYLALEGGTKINQYLFIVDSFVLTR